MDLMSLACFFFFLGIFRVNVKLPTVEVRYKDLSVEAKCEVVSGKPLPTLWNSFLSMISVRIFFFLGDRSMNPML